MAASARARCESRKRCRWPAGDRFTGEYVHKRTKVLIVSFEDDAKELRRRVLAARLYYNVSAADVAGWLYLAAPGRSVGKLMMLSSKGGIVQGSLGQFIEDAITRRGVGLIILDPFVKTHGIPENLNNEMDSVAQLLTDIAAKHNVAIDFPHHISKGAADPGNANRGRGATATVNAGRLVYTLATMSPDEANLFDIPEDQRREFVRLDRAKLNIARASGPATWFRLIGVRLDNATTDYPNGDAVQTVAPWSPPETWAGLDSETINRILTDIDKGMDDGNFYTVTNSKTDRAAWQVVQRFAPNKSAGQAREIIASWVKSELLTQFDYVNPKTRQSVKGLKVDSTKRP